MTAPALPSPTPVIKKQPLPVVIAPEAIGKFAPALPSGVGKLPPQVPAVSDITTGSVEHRAPTRMLDPDDSARLFSGAEDVPPGELITGAVDTPVSDLARGYCVNIADAAAEARIALQRSKLADIEKDISRRIAALEAKTAEYKQWMERRDEFLKRANESLVKIYSQMEPEAAAMQLVSMDEETAAALLVKVEPQNASAILNEMPPEKAARLTATISGAARRSAPGRPPASAPAAQRPAANPGEGRS